MNVRGLSRCQALLLGKLGDPYRVNRIDGASCIYRDFGDHDVEICGGRTKRALYHIFVWRKKPGRSPPPGQILPKAPADSC